MNSRSYSDDDDGSSEDDGGMQDMMMPMMMMNMMGTGRKKEQDGGNAALMESLRKQNEMIMALNSGGYAGENKDGENTLLMNRLGELEEKLATKFNKTNQGAGGMDALFSEDMMSMLMLNMQSSIQMLPLLQQRQMQQKQNGMQFQTYISQMQALNSMLHTLSYGTPLSELNKLHSGVKNQFESYNNEVSSRLKGVINQVKDMNKATELEKEKIQQQLNDPDMKSEDDDEEFKDELDKLEENIEAKYQAKAQATQPISVGGAPDYSTSSKPKASQAFQNAAAFSQAPAFSQPQQFYGVQQPQYHNPYYTQAMNQNQVPYGFEWQYDPTASKTSKKSEKKKKKRDSSSSSSDHKKKKKKATRKDSASESKVSALDSPREGPAKPDKNMQDQMNALFPGMPNLDKMDPMARNMALLNMLNSLNEPDVRKKKKKKKAKHRDEDSDIEPSRPKQVFYHPSNLAFPNQGLLAGNYGQPQTSRRTDRQPAPGFSQAANINPGKKKPTFSDTQSMNFNR